jgi:hypothetical protein
LSPLGGAITMVTTRIGGVDALFTNNPDEYPRT